MEFRRHEDADQRTLVADDGSDTPITIANLCADGFGFVVYWNDDTWGAADTFGEAKRIALECSEGR